MRIVEMSGTAAQSLPRWDLTTIYPGVDSEEYAKSVDRLVALIEELEMLLAAAEATDTASLDEVTVAFERVIGVFNESLGLARHNRWYLQAHVSGNTRDSAAQARMSALQAVRTRRAIAETRFIAWLGRIDVGALIAGPKEAWRLWREPFAAALNGVKGEHITLARERGWDSVLDESLFLNRMDGATLDAMLDASRRSLPDFRRYLRAVS